MIRKRTGLVAIVMAGAMGIGAAANFAVAQDNGRQSSGQNNNNNNNGGDRSNRGRGGWDPQQMWNQVKEQLGASDDEWKVLQPRVEKVFQLNMQSRMSMFGGGVPAGRGSQQPSEPVRESGPGGDEGAGGPAVGDRR